MGQKQKREKLFNWSKADNPGRGNMKARSMGDEILGITV